MQKKKKKKTQRCTKMGTACNRSEQQMEKIAVGSAEKKSYDTIAQLHPH